MAEQLGLFDVPTAAPPKVQPVAAASPPAMISPPSDEGREIIMPAVRPCVVPGAPVLHDGECRLAIAGRPAMLVAWYLIASWAYYVGDHPLISDGLFDELCRDLAAAWDGVEHRHKHLIDRGWLAAGTCLLAREAYPAVARGAAAHLAWTAAGVRLPRE